jgi:DUF971 family protein
MKPSHTKAPTELKNEKEKRYLVQTWQDGSICDLTEKPRTIEVQVKFFNLQLYKTKSLS